MPELPYFFVIVAKRAANCRSLSVSPRLRFRSTEIFPQSVRPARDGSIQIQKQDRTTSDTEAHVLDIGETRMMTANSAKRQWLGQSSASVGGIGSLCFFTIIVTTLLSSAILVSCGRSVRYDHRALLIDGQRRFLISGSIHYPRSTPQMWPRLLALAKAGGLDAIDSYVFWNGHEPVKGQYNFQGRYDLVGFLREVQKADLLMTLRIGPYIDGEWNFGGFPNWLLRIPGIEFRTDNEPFKEQMERFVRFLVTMLQENNMFYIQGGPIILAQIENEYSHVGTWYGEAGKRYSDWAANMALSLNIGVPWIMCQQREAPDGIIITCNGFYCDRFQPIAYNQPKLYTELYTGWAHYWGQTLVRRPLEDVAFAAATFFQSGGSLINYYMYHGGTNFGRTAGAGITTSYDFFAPIDEGGQVRHPEWSHLAQLNSAIKLCAPAMAAVDDAPSNWIPGRYLEISIYNSTTTTTNYTSDDGSSPSFSHCAAFLMNRDWVNDAIMELQGRFYHVPAWSVSILPDCKTVLLFTAPFANYLQVLFNTATVIAQTSTKTMVPLIQLDKNPRLATSTHTAHNASRRGKQIVLQHETNCEIVEDDEGGGGTEGLRWEWFQEPIGISPLTENIIAANKPLEEFSVTQDSTDYLWYSTKFNISNSQSSSQDSPLWLNVRKTQKYGLLHVFINGNKVSDDQPPLVLNSSVHQSQLQFNPLPGTNTIDLLSVTLGHPSSGPWIERKTGGISGSITIGGLAFNGHLDLRHSQWKHLVGLMGEHLHLESKDETDGKMLWASGKPPMNQPLIWYKTTVDYTSSTDGLVALDMRSMKKGLAWINGHQLGRYWPSRINPSTAVCSPGCDYRGRFNGPAGGKCGVDCGQLSQRWYHVPDEWLKPSGNRLVLFEEIGGDPHGISLSRAAVQSVCAHVSEDYGQQCQETDLESTPGHINLKHPDLQIKETHLKSMSQEDQLNLDCGPGSTIATIKFASWGNPLGTCGNFTQGSCHASRSEEVVKKACIGRQHCWLSVDRKLFVDGENFCPSGQKLKLAVEALCIQS